MLCFWALLVSQGLKRSNFDEELAAFMDFFAAPLTQLWLKW